MAYGKIEYNDKGLPKCELCGEAHHRLMGHVRQRHKMTAVEYKKLFGLDLGKGICSAESSEKARVAAIDNLPRIIDNLVVGGKSTRFTPGCQGRTKDLVSEETRTRLRERLKTPKMQEVLKKSGYALGKSGIGNKKRWVAKQVETVTKNKTMSKIIYHPDGFAFLDVTDKAKELFASELFPVYEVREDGSESLITTYADLQSALEAGSAVGIELGHVNFNVSDAT